MKYKQWKQGLVIVFVCHYAELKWQKYAGYVMRGSSGDTPLPILE